MDLYAENILDHSKTPRGKRALANPSVTHGEKNLSCGDGLTLQLLVKDGVIQELGWDGAGCAISQAGMSMLAEELEGKTVAEAAAIGPKHVTDLLGVPIGPRRLKCALLSLHTLQNTLRALNDLPPQTLRETMQTDDD
jgi:nitrogen fixation protein NifU and related proteins